MVPLTRAKYLEREADAMSEDALQARVIALAKELDYLAYHTYNSRRSQPGWPDLVLGSLSRRRLVIRELKTSRGRVSPAQTAWLLVLRACGVDAGVWRPMDLLDGTILRILTAPPKEH